MNELKTDLGVAEIISPDILFFEYHENIELGESELIEILTILKNYVSKNGRVKLIIEIPPTSIMNLEGMTYLKENKYKNENTIALALVLKSIAQRVGSKFYHTKIEVGSPTKFFKSKEEAISWISEI